AALPEAAWANDARFTDAAGRTEHDAELAQALEATFASRPAEDWERELIEAGVGCVRADGATVGEFFTRDGHSLENGFAPEAEHADFGRLRRWGPLTMVDGGAEQYRAGAIAGADTDALLGELGYGADAIAALRAERIVTG
ncbi:MAG: CoA transferase, partial [Planctomycetota bacterium]